MQQYSILHTDNFIDYAYDFGYNVFTDYQELKNTKGKQLKNCQAWIIPVELMDRNTGEILQAEALQSYNTIVAFKVKGNTFRCGKYSPTTSKQTTWFARG